MICRLELGCYKTIYYKYNSVLVKCLATKRACKHTLQLEWFGMDSNCLNLKRIVNKYLQTYFVLSPLFSRKLINANLVNFEVYLKVPVS